MALSQYYDTIQYDTMQFGIVPSSSEIRYVFQWNIWNELPEQATFVIR